MQWVLPLSRQDDAFRLCGDALQVIGELVGKLLKEASQPLSNHPEIPWVQIYDMRNLISHEYANIDEAVVFSAIKEDLPQLRPVIEELLKD